MMWDVFRFVAMFLYAALVVQVLSTAWFYFKFSKSFSHHIDGVIPTHVWALGIGLSFLATEVVWVNIENLGEGFRLYALLNPILFLYMNIVTLQIGNFERRRYIQSKARRNGSK